VVVGQEAMPFAGVIEGFYGPPWSQTERLELFDRMSEWGLNTYLYCPKDDLHHRAIWREPYAGEDVAPLAQLVGDCRARNIRFIYGLGPGLDIRYGDVNDVERLRARFAQLLSLGCHHFALLFDDIPDRLDPDDLARWGSLAAAQSHVASSLFSWLRLLRIDVTLAFCPTPYCGRMAAAGHGGPGYLETVGHALAPEIDVFWTGPEIVSDEISVAHVREVQALLRRKPVLWDNLHANDYDGRRFFCGPYAGRPQDLRGDVRGILSNPNTEFPLNDVPLRTLAAFVQSTGPWDARTAYLSAMREWLPSFETVSGPADFDLLVLLGDCYYLPSRDGPTADDLDALARYALSATSTAWRDDAVAFVRGAVRLREFCGRLATLRDRRLFHALNRRTWDLREELDLLIRCVETRLQSTNTAMPVLRSDFHRPGTYRGGMAARLQRLLVQHPDGTFTPHADEIAT
jgi:protein O-GlcNAcase/histone acetyltransferase